MGYSPMTDDRMCCPNGVDFQSCDPGYGCLFAEIGLISWNWVSFLLKFGKFPGYGCPSYTIFQKLGKFFRCFGRHIHRGFKNSIDCVMHVPSIRNSFVKCRYCELLFFSKKLKFYINLLYKKETIV